MGRITRESIEEVRRANDIVEVVSGYLALKRKGTGYWANCPFHDEKSPSFQVHQVRQTYKCFGCGVFGNVIDFVIAQEKLDFVEAVEKLADRAGVRLQYEGGGPTPADRSVRTRALEMMEWAQRGFSANLAKTPAALAYLDSRGLGGEVARRWGLGYAPDEYTRLYEAARRTFTEDVIEATGLAKRGDRGWYDFFRGRVTFPIRDAQGRIVGFGARLLDPEAKAQKYLNSAEGLLFSKSKLLYAIDKLAHSERLKKTGRVLVMEGYTDVIAAHEAGFDNAVAPLGTALTREQLGLLRRYGKGVTLVLDGDAAGQAAAERAVNVALEAGVDADVAVIRDAKDPFDLLRAKGAAAFEQTLAQAVDAFDFKLEAVRKRFDLSRPVEAESALHELAETFGRADSQSLRELYARRVAGLLSLREAVVLAALSEAHTRHARAATRPGEQPESQPAVKAAVADPRIAYERELLRRMLEHPRAIAGAASIVFPEVFSVPALRELYREMLNAWDEHGEVVPGALVTHLGAEARAELQEVVKHMTHDEATAPQPDADEAAALLIDELRKLAEHKPATGKAQDLAALRDQKLARKGPKGPKRA